MVFGESSSCLLGYYRMLVARGAVTGSLLHSPQPSVGSYFAAFYGRRLKRLTPALALFLIVTCILIAVPGDWPLSIHGLTPRVRQIYYAMAQV